MTERYHPGDDADDIDLADVLAEEDHDDAILEGDYDVSEPENAGDVDTIKHEDKAACRWCHEEFDSHLDEGEHLCNGRREWLLGQADHDAAVIESKTHELETKLLFHEHGLSPYWAIGKEFDRCLQDDDDQDDIGTFDAVGDSWNLNHEEQKVKKWESGLAPPPGNDTIDGGLNEYQINVVSDAGEDDEETRSINFRFKPAYPNATHHETGDEIRSLPSQMPEGVRVTIDSSNLEFAETLEVLRALVSEMTINPDYFQYDALHGWSRVINLGIYVRIKRDIGEDQIVALDTGLIDRLFDFGHRQGGKGELHWDNEEIMGHRNTITMDATTRSKFALPASVATRLKYYHPKHPRSSANRDDPLAHPKVEVQFSKKHTGSAVPLDSDLPAPTADGDDEIETERGVLPQEYDYDSLYAEMDEWLVNSLYWADVPIRADPQVYVADSFWTPTESERDLQLVEDPMPTMREREERLAEYHVLQADATPDQQDVLAVATDGGQQDISRVAEKAGVSERTVRRAVDAFDPILEVVNGKIASADGVIREKVDQLLGTMEDAADWVSSSIDDLLDNREHTIDEDSAFAKWMRTYGVNLVEEGSSTEIAIHVGHYSKAEIQRVLREGLQAARHTGHNLHDTLLMAGASWYDAEGNRRSTERAFAIQGNGISVLGNILARIG